VVKKAPPASDLRTAASGDRGEEAAPVAAHAPVLERLRARELAVERGADRQLAKRRVDARKA
jgi:hypothetical protein